MVSKIARIPRNFWKPRSKVRCDGTNYEFLACIARTAIIDIVTQCTGHNREPCKKEPTEMQTSHMDPTNHVLDWDCGVHDGASWRIRRNYLCSDGDAGCCYHNHSKKPNIQGGPEPPPRNFQFTILMKTVLRFH